MGFLEEIERRKRQQMQEEQNLKTQKERDQLLAAKKIEEEKQKRQREFEVNSQRYLREASILTSVFDKLNNYGYKDYFENVAKISGFDLKRYLYTNFPEPHFDEKASEIGKRQEKSRTNLGASIARLGWPPVQSNLYEYSYGYSRFYIKNPNLLFFGDNVISAKGLTEPTRIGVGVRFLAHARTKENLNTLARIFKVSHEYLVEDWENAVYIRMGEFEDVLITGSSQQRVILSDLTSFDKALHQAFQHPAVVYSFRKEKSDYSSSSGSHRGEDGLGI